MKFYCGIDLSARDCHVCVIDEQLKIVVQQKLRNELAKICQQFTTQGTSAWS
jgi:predicted nuclease with RNAse H fold